MGNATRVILASAGRRTFGRSAGEERRHAGAGGLARTALVLCVLSATGCTKLGPEFVRPEAQVNEDWNSRA